MLAQCWRKNLDAFQPQWGDCLLYALWCVCVCQTRNTVIMNFNSQSASKWFDANNLIFRRAFNFVHCCCLRRCCSLLLLLLLLLLPLLPMLLRQWHLRQKPMQYNPRVRNVRDCVCGSTFPITLPHVKYKRCSNLIKFHHVYLTPTASFLFPLSFILCLTPIRAMFATKTFGLENAAGHRL